MPTGISKDAWERIRGQASLQHGARITGDDKWVVLPPRRGVGLALLPNPSPGDLFFDFEGNPFWDAEGSLEYLWGILDVDRNFEPLHAYDHDTERAAFEQFIDIVHGRLAAYPDMHVYHYAQYEITALRRLMGRYGTREAELDDLLRREVFVDLYKVVRNGVRTSRPGYGLKELETFLAGFHRSAEVKDGGTSIIVFEEWMHSRDPALLAQIDAYNEEDCLATLLLRDWLLELRGRARAEFGELPLRPEPEPPKPIPGKGAERAELRDQLHDAGHELAAQLLDYHDRERKPVWWAFFDRVETDHDHVEDAESIGGLELVGEPEVADTSKAYTFAFPAQEHKIGQGQDVVDPDTGKSPGSILEVDREARRIIIRRGPKVDERPLPRALIPGGPYRTDDQEDALVRLGESLVAGGGGYPALETILDRTPFDQSIQTADLDEMKALVLGLDGQHLVIQGPPGSGKTWTSGRLIAYLMQHGKTVGIASTSHKAIHNLVDSVEEAAAEIGLYFTGIKKASSGNAESIYPGDVVTNVTDGGACVGCDLVAGTAWLFSRPDHDGRWDYLFVDEAGQVSLADALAMGASAQNVVLVGDPQQLDQVIQGTHPAGSGASVLKHLIGDDETIAPDRGLFLERTFRMHPDVCGYISEEYLRGPPVSGREYLGAHDPVRDGAAFRAGRARRVPSGIPGGSGCGRRTGERAARRRCARFGDHGRFAVQHAGQRAHGCTSRRRPRRHRRQVSRAGSRCGPLFACELERRGRPAWARVPALAQSIQRRDLTRQVSCLPRREPEASRGELPHDPADAIGECALPFRRARRGYGSLTQPRRRVTSPKSADSVTPSTWTSPRPSACANAE